LENTNFRSKLFLLEGPNRCKEHIRFMKRGIEEEQNHLGENYRLHWFMIMYHRQKKHKYMNTEQIKPKE